MLGEYTAGLYGHSHPVIRAAMDRALDDGSTSAATTRWRRKLARLVCERFPSVDLVRFTNSGTEANLMAHRHRRRRDRPRKVMVFEGGYHGGVLYFVGGGPARSTCRTTA